MNINKDNYEEYFLLFADNELSGAEKDMVEAFVKQHTELEEEFLTIQQSVFSVDDELKLEDKSALFRHTEKIINHTNYEEVLVRYVDNELTSLERKQTETFLSENPSLQNELEVFEKLKLQPDKRIVFPNKKLLLKKEDKGKVVPFKWWKAIAAAVLLGLGTWVGIDFQKKNKVEAPIAIKNNLPEKTAKINSIPTDTINNKQVNVVAYNQQAKPLLQKKSAQNNINKLPVKGSNRKPAVVSNYQALKTVRKTNDLPVPAMDNIVQRDEKQGPGIIVKEAQKNNTDNVLIENNTIVNNGNNQNDNNQAQQDELLTPDKNAVPGVVVTAYTSAQSENNDNYAFYNISEEKFNKSKVGGFLRKVKRIIERKISPLNSSKNQREIAVN